MHWPAVKRSPVQGVLTNHEAEITSETCMAGTGEDVPQKYERGAVGTAGAQVGRHQPAADGERFVSCEYLKDFNRQVPSQPSLIIHHSFPRNHSLLYK